MTTTDKAIEALRYYRDECSGAEPSLSVFHRMLDEALADSQRQQAEAGIWQDIDRKLSTMAPVEQVEPVSQGRANPGDETGGAVRRFGLDLSDGQGKIIPATNGAFVWYEDYLALWKRAQPVAGGVPEAWLIGMAETWEENAKEADAKGWHTEASAFNTYAKDARRAIRRAASPQPQQAAPASRTSAAMQELRAQVDAEQGLSDAEIAAAVRPLYQSDEAAALGLADDIATVRAVLTAADAAAPQAAQAQLADDLRRALEVIALGDSKNPPADAADELVALGIWRAESVAEARKEGLLAAQAQEPDRQQLCKELTRLADILRDCGRLVSPKGSAESVLRYAASVITEQGGTHHG